MRRLLEYEQMKMAAAAWGSCRNMAATFEGTGADRTKPATPHPRCACGGAAEAWRDILKRAKLVQHHKITREELSVREYMSMVLAKPLAGRRFVEFEELFERKGSTVLVVTFIALLSWPKRRLIEITQAEAFAPFTCGSAYTPV